MHQMDKYEVGKHVVDAVYEKGDVVRLEPRCFAGLHADCRYRKGVEGEVCDITDYLKDVGVWDCFDGSKPDGFILKEKGNEIEFYWNGFGEDAEGWWKFR